MGTRRSRHSRLMSQINVVPYIDVMLVLLVIFMVTAPLLQTGIEVDLPEVDAKPLDEQQKEEQEPLVVVVDREGRFFLGSSSALSREDLIERVTEKLTARDDGLAYVKGDRSVDYGRVVEAMVILQQAGAEKVGLITEPPPEETSR